MLFISAICLEANGYASTAWQQPQKHKNQKKNEQPVVVQSLDFDYRVEFPNGIVATLLR